MNIYLARHGNQNVGDSPDSGFTRTGHTEASELANALRDEGIQIAFTSSLTRARETAEHFWPLPFFAPLDGLISGLIRLQQLLLFVPVRTGPEPVDPVHCVAAHCWTPAAILQPSPVRPSATGTSSRSGIPGEPCH